MIADIYIQYNKNTARHVYLYRVAYEWNWHL